MEKFRLIALVLAIIVVSVSLCSCQALDAARDSQAFYHDSKREIIWLDQTYKVMNTEKFSIINTDIRELRVTASDVPVLLSDLVGDYGIVERKDDSVISVYGEYYVREDKYEVMKEVLEGAVLDHYYISFYSDSYYSYRSPDGNYDVDYWDVSNLSTILLDQDVTDVINNALAASEREKVRLDEESMQSAKAMIVSPCDTEMMLTNDKTDQIVLLRDGENFYVYISEFWNSSEDDGYSVFMIDKEGVELVKSLFDKYPQAVDQTIF